MLTLDFAGDTNIGKKRETNQDHFAIVAEQDLVVVADGMGGHLAGDIASKLAVSSICDFFLQTSDDRDITWPFRPKTELDYHTNRIVNAMKLANRAVYEKASMKRAYRGMGTTAVMFHYNGDTAIVGHVGDSRVYLFRHGKLRQLTEDHSLLNDFKKNISMTPEDEAKFPYKNIIIRALGMKDRVEVDTTSLAPQSGDLILLCTDGLTGEVDDQALEDILGEGDNLQDKIDTMIDQAMANGGKDNITASIARFTGTDEDELTELETILEPACLFEDDQEQSDSGALE